MFFLIVPTSLQALDALEYDARLCTAGIIVLNADLRQQLSPATSGQQKIWLQQRNAGTLSTLTWLCRRYAVLHQLDVIRMRADTEQLRHTFETKKWMSAHQQLSVLSASMPLESENLGPVMASRTALIEGGQIYSKYCKSCHFRSAPNAVPPIFSLSEMARNLPRKEFIARMIIGVHGTPQIGLQNPLSDRDISGMFAYLLGVKPTE